MFDDRAAFIYYLKKNEDDKSMSICMYANILNMFFQFSYKSPFSIFKVNIGGAVCVSLILKAPKIRDRP